MNRRFDVMSCLHIFQIVRQRLGQITHNDPAILDGVRAGNQQLIDSRVSDEFELDVAGTTLVRPILISKAGVVQHAKFSQLRLRIGLHTPIDGLVVYRFQ